METFYSSVTSFCFVLMGLWWNVAQARAQEWSDDPHTRRLAGGVYMSFLIPGLMSLAAQIAGDARFLWRAVFVVAALFGAFSVVGFARAMFRTTVPGGWVGRNLWLVVLLYGLVAVVGAVPELAAPLRLAPLQVEGVLLSGLIFIGVSFAWEVITEPRSEASPDAPGQALEANPLLRTLGRSKPIAPHSKR